MYERKKISKLVEKYRRKFKSAEADVERYRSEWDPLKKRLNKIFEQLQDEQSSNKFYSSLFIQDENYTIEDVKVKNRRYFAYCFGAKRLNISESTYDSASGRLKHFKQEIEDGGALFFTQGIKGEVLVYLLPSQNKLISKIEEPLLLNVYSNPSKVSKRKILKHLSQFFWFTLVSSFLTNLSWKDQFFIHYYKIRSRTLNLNWPIILPALILLVSILHLILFIIYVLN